MDSKKTIEMINNNFLSNLILQGANYASVHLVSKKKECIYVSSNNIWNELYHNNNFSTNCHLISAAKVLINQKDNFTLLWDTIIPNTEMAAVINEHRMKNGMYHGISFIRKNSQGIIQSINLASNYGNLTFVKSVIENKEKIFNGFSKMVLF